MRIRAQFASSVGGAKGPSARRQQERLEQPDWVQFSAARGISQHVVGMGGGGSMATQSTDKLVMFILCLYFPPGKPSFWVSNLQNWAHLPMLIIRCFGVAVELTVGAV